MYYLGIDGGATKTLMLLVNEDASIVRVVKTTSSNPFDIGIEKAKQVLKDGIDKILAIDGVDIASVSVFAGLSGGNTGDSKKKIYDFLVSLGFNKVDNDSHAVNIIKAGLNESDGVALIMGTGSCTFVQKNGEIKRIGGLGYLFEHYGSAYDIGNAVITYSIRAENGTGEQTAMKDMLIEKCPYDTAMANLSYFYEIGKTGIASFAPIAFSAYLKGDKVAKKILQDNAYYIATLLSADRKLLDTDKVTKVACVGGVTKSFDVFYPFIKDALDEIDSAKNFDLKVFDGDVAMGALVKAGLDNRLLDKVKKQL